MDNNKLQKADVQQIPPWVRHFLIHVLGRCCSIVVKWIEEMKEAGKEPYQVESGTPNGRSSR